VAIDWLTYDHFAGRVGETFELADAEPPGARLVLADATESTEPGGRGPEGQERLQFSLVFHGAPFLSQGTYRLAHAELGELELFLVPIGRDVDGTRYEAAFA
jgi:hypothetical protein